MFTERAIPSSLIKLLRLFSSKSIRKVTLWNFGIFFLLFLLFNLFTFQYLSNLLNENLDVRLHDEVDRIKNSLTTENDKLILKYFSELNEVEFTEISARSYFLQIYDQRGEILIASDNISGFPNIQKKFFDELPVEFYETVELNNTSLRVHYESIIATDGKLIGYLQLSTNATETATIFTDLLTLNLKILPLATLLLILASIFVIGKNYMPIENIIQVAESISTSDLSRKVEIDVDEKDILGRLRDTLNSLFERLRDQISQISQFTDNASHQLMNPLTAVKSELEYILKKDRSEAEYRESLEMLNIQTNKMISIVKTLLQISKTGIQADTIKELVDIPKILNEIVSNDKSERLKFSAGNSVYVKGDKELLKIAIENLIENALKYSDEDVNIEVKKDGAYVNLNFIDRGIGIPDSEKENIFSRFYRSSNAENKGIQGYGLGLNLSMHIITNMNGKITVANNHPHGAIFTIKLPLLKIA